MKILSVNGSVSASALFRVIATGYSLGVIAIFGPIFLIVSVFVLFGAPFDGPRWQVLMFPIILPIVAILQGIMLGAVATLGLAIYRWYRRIEVVESRTPQSDSLL